MPIIILLTTLPPVGGEGKEWGGGDGSEKGKEKMGGVNDATRQKEDGSQGTNITAWRKG